ncbi:hypothetical protein N3K66_005267 [Trichothecium roseum]|uniref:Uncharacterized protein n=1 Tax=Trichothecium roseum TaxID=47278 RepID=A0ACC0V3N3_9HYPO|nr:hypothetical protein N3K66_005267 [Trichothecium roseum]
MAPTDFEHTVIWLDRFLNFRYPLEGYADHREKVKVAILDTGIDLCMFKDSPFLERIKERKSFLSDAEQPKQEGTCNGSDSTSAKASVHDETPERHGSYIAKLILSYAPWADIYVARVVKDHKTSMDPNCFAKAIEHAVADWKVHIISISSGFGTSYECIEKAIHFAYEQGVAVLAAASNDGANRAMADQVPFPARMSEVICINSSDGYGNPSAFNPPAVDGTFNFMTLGESVPIPPEPDGHQGGEAHGENVHRETGTSFATPIAASIAACFMEFLLQNLLRKDKQVPKELHPRDVVTRLFAGMSSSHNNFRYLRPWDLINCKPESENHKCSKTCRIRAADKIKAYLKGPVPAPEVKMPDLPHVPDAEFDAELQRISKGQCLENTRVEVLKSIRRWIKSSPRQVVVGLLVGRAGSGKSAIARTVAQELSSDQCLGASFFFTRSQTKYGDAFDFVSSVAYQLAKHRPRLAALVRNAIENDPDLRESSKSSRVQWQKLVVIPLMSVDTTTVILIDGLDEAKQPSEILSLLQQLESIKAPVTVFVTSRREIGIDNVVHNWQREPREFDLDSEFMFSDTHRDITHFVEQDLGFMNKSGPLTSLSVEKGDFRALADKANGLFVYAALACRYIRGSGNQSTTPKQRLKQVIDAHHFKDLDALYGGILSEATAGPDEQEVDRQLRHILGLVLTLRTPLPESVFHLFCPEDMNAELVSYRLNSLHSVLVIRNDPNQPVQVFHESFRSFLVENFGVDLKRAHRNIFSRCMKIMPKTLQMDICSIGNMGVDIKAIPSTAIDNCLPLQVKYACEYWLDHLEDLDQADCEAAPLVDDGTVHTFLKKLFLHWLEALCLMEKIHVAIFSTRRLRRMVSGKDEALQLSRFVRDAQHFVQHNNWVLQHRPLQLYSSALIFSPTHSIVRMQFEHMMPECILGQPAMDNDWPCFQTLESRKPMRHVLFAPNSMMLATLGSGIVSIWDAETGRCIYELQHEAVARAAFSSNSEILATGNATARIYDPDSGRRLGTLGSYSVNVWDLKTGASIKTLASGKESIAGLAFSENSRWLAFASQDGIISIYGLNSKQCAFNTLHALSQL